MSTTVTHDEYMLRSLTTSPGSIKHFKNGTQLNAETNVANKTGVQLFIHSRLTVNTNIQELVFYDTDRSTDQSGIEGNINTYFSIYT